MARDPSIPRLETSSPKPPAATSTEAGGKASSGAASRWTFWGLGLVLFLTSLAYSQALSFGFVYDDRDQIVHDPYIRTWTYLGRYFTRDVWDLSKGGQWGNYYRPLFLLWLRLNYLVFGLHAAWWHLASLLVHLSVVWMVYALARRLSGDRPMAVIAAVIFGLHPVHIESVVWASGITDPLAALLLLGSFLGYLRWRDQAGGGWLFVSWVCYALSLLSKETAVALPVYILAYEWLWRAPLRRRGIAATGKAWVRQVALILSPYAFLTLVYLAVRWHVIGGLGHVIVRLSTATLLLTCPSILWFYLRHLLWPFGINAFYVMPYVERPDWRQFALPGVILLGAAATLAFWWRRKAQADPMESRCVALATIWMVLPILPVLDVSIFASGQLAHDRYLYLPSVGFAILAAMALRHLKIGSGFAFGVPSAQIASVLGIAFVLGIAIPRQDQCWKDNMVFYTRALEVVPNYDPVMINFANILRDRGQPDRAIELYRGVLARRPGNWLATYDLAFTYYTLGRLTEAKEYFRRSILIDPTRPDQYLYAGLTLLRLNDLRDAEAAMRAAIHLLPNGRAYHLSLGVVLNLEGRHEDALREFEIELVNYPEETAAKEQIAQTEQLIKTEEQGAAHGSPTGSTDGKAQPH